VSFYSFLVKKGRTVMILRLCQAKLFDKQRGYYVVYYYSLGFLWQRKRNERVPNFRNSLCKFKSVEHISNWPIWH